MAVKIYAVHDRSGFAGSGTGAGNWDNAHDGASAKNAYFAQEDGAQGVRVAYDAAANAVHLYRAFFEFAVPVDAPSSISSLTLNIKGKSSNNDLDVIVVQGTQDVSTDGDGSAYNFTVFNAFTGHGSGWDDSDVTEYSSEVTSWSNSAYNTITLNATARAAFTPGQNFKVALISHDYDYLDVDPSSLSGFDESIDFYLQGSGTSQDPYIEYEAADPRDITGPLKIQAGGKFKISAGKLTIKT